MNVLIIGNGSREHAITWKILQSPLADNVYVSPGNAGTASIAKNIDVASTNIPMQLAIAKEYNIDLAVIGPEGPLAKGIVDRFNENNIPVFGPSQSASAIESSKAFAKHLMNKYQIPTGGFKTFQSLDEASDYLLNHNLPVVIKANGLAAGKGVTIVNSYDEGIKALEDCLTQRLLGNAGDTVLIEEFLTGTELSVFGFTDGKSISNLIGACDYKRAYDGDKGPNTGGMGSYSPPPFWTPELEEEIRETIMLPTIKALAQEGSPFLGILYGGIMLTESGPKVLEFNCRFGDPETQVILPQMSSDLLAAMQSVVNGTLNETQIVWSNKPHVGVVMSSGGYPNEYKLGAPISGLDNQNMRSLLFHGGTKLDSLSNSVVNNGGRVLTVVSSGETINQARLQAYEDIEQIHFSECFYRKDIAVGI